jgi:hypothetical protein
MKEATTTAEMATTRTVLKLPPGGSEEELPLTQESPLLGTEVAGVVVTRGQHFSLSKS